VSKRSFKNWSNFVIYKKLLQVNNQSKGENLPNLVTLKANNHLVGENSPNLVTLTCCPIVRRRSVLRSKLSTSPGVDFIKLYFGRRVFVQFFITKLKNRQRGHNTTGQIIWLLKKKIRIKWHLLTLKSKNYEFIKASFSFLSINYGWNEFICM
jgi:hypothetical protein